MTRKRSWFLDYNDSDSKKVYIYHISPDGSKKRISISNRIDSDLICGAVVKLTEISSGPELKKKYDFPIRVILTL